MASTCFRDVAFNSWRSKDAITDERREDLATKAGIT